MLPSEPEVEGLRKEMAVLQDNNVKLRQQLEEEKRENTRLAHEIARQKKEKDELAEEKREALEPQPASQTQGSTSHSPAFESVIPVEATLRRTLTSFNIAVNKEALDESSPTGKVLTRGLKSFFDEPKGFGAIMIELERVYGLSRTSGGTRQSVQEALVELCAKGWHACYGGVEEAHLTGRRLSPA